MLDPLATAERGQAMVQKDLSSAVIVGLVLGLTGLFGWLMHAFGKLNRVQEERVRERDALAREMLAFMREASQTLFVLGEKVAETGRKVDELHGKKRPPAPVAGGREGAQ